jgi:Fe-S cluster biogenesis protein NfuA
VPLQRRYYPTSGGAAMDGGTDEVARRLKAVGQALGSHGGGIEFVELARGGHLRVRLTGACAGCQLKPLTMTTIVLPGLEGADGVRRVEVLGGRISRAAELRLRALQSSASRTLTFRNGLHDITNERGDDGGSVS